MSIFDVALSIGYHGQETWLRLLEALLAEAQRRPTERQALRRLAGYQSERDDNLPGDPFWQMLRARLLSGAYKQCAHWRCQAVLPATERYFYRDKRNPDGLYSYCKTCWSRYAAAKNREYRQSETLPHTNDFAK